MRKLSRRSFASFATGVALMSAGAMISSAPFAFAANNTASVEIMLLQATNGPPPGSIDPKVDDGKPPTPPQNLPSYKLKQPPLSAYNTYKLIGPKAKLALVSGAPQSVPLPNGSTLEVTLSNAATQNGTPRATLTVVSIDAQKNRTQLGGYTGSPGQSVFVGGINFPPGKLVIAFTF